MTAQLAGKAVLITGAGRGIGRGLALAFASEGAQVAVLARTASEVHETALEIREKGGQSLAFAADVTNAEEVRRSVETVLADFGKIDILINNAGYAHFRPFHELSLAEWRQTLDVNLTGPFLCIQAVLPYMKAQGAGRIINISSVAGLKGYAEQSAYCASKHGLNGLTKALAIELHEYGISVHSLCPGGVDTRLTREVMPHRDKTDWMTPEDIAHACLYLATLSPRATTDELVIRRINSVPG